MAKHLVFPPLKRLGRASHLALAILAALALALAAFLVAPPVEGPELAVPAGGPSPAVADGDGPLPDGYFYRQRDAGSPSHLGYAVQGDMWQAFQAAGGFASLGHPMSRSWSEDDGRTYQAFERALLALSTDGDKLRFDRVEVLDLLSARGQDEWLARTFQLAIPVERAGGPLRPAAGLALLDRDPAIRRAFLSTPDWQDRFGLPVAISIGEEVVTLLAERAVLRHWLVENPRAAQGAVIVAEAGELAKSGGLVPPFAAPPSVSPLRGWLKVSGGQIVDGLGKPVRLSGVNWTGFELVDFAPRGLHQRDYRDIVDRVAALGFNAIRLPFSDEMVERNPLPLPETIAGCPECQGRRSLEIMDMIVSYAGQQGLRIILDNHFSAAGDQKGAVLWHSPEYPESVWIQHWRLLAQRYRDSPAVIGFDLRNEPHGRATWGSGDPATDWRLAAEKAGQAILAINPEVLIIVEGIEQYPKPGGMDLTWWGGNLQGAREFPIRLPAANLLYSPHDYGPTLWRQWWFNPGTTAQSLLAVWLRFWAFLNLEQGQPLLIGELGTGNGPTDVASAEAGSQGQWFQAMVGLLEEQPNLSWIYWTIDHADPFSLLDGTYEKPANPEKLAALRPIMGEPFPPLSALDTVANYTDRAVSASGPS